MLFSFGGAILHEAVKRERNSKEKKLKNVIGGGRETQLMVFISTPFAIPPHIHSCISCCFHHIHTLPHTLMFLENLINSFQEWLFDLPFVSTHFLFFLYFSWDSFAIPSSYMNKLPQHTFGLVTYLCIQTTCIQHPFLILYIFVLSHTLFHHAFPSTPISHLYFFWYTNCHLHIMKWEEAHSNTEPFFSQQQISLQQTV